MSFDYLLIFGKMFVEGFYLSIGWGIWGFKGIFVSGEQMVGLLVMGEMFEFIVFFNFDCFVVDCMLVDCGFVGIY